MREKYDLALVGGGIVGLSTALALSKSFPDLSIVLLEKEAQVAAHQTSHNSGVIHSGVYYRPGSLKAKFCVAGAAAMYEFCAEHNIEYERCGKLIVATTREQLPALEELRKRGEQNGVAGLRILSASELKEVEPHAAGLGALSVPAAGITAYKSVAMKMAELAASRGVEVVTSAEVYDIRQSSSGLHLRSSAGDVTASYLINCAGLYSDRIATMMNANPDVRIIPFRGEYYELAPARRFLVRNLVYPVPDMRFPFLGVHFTRRITGQIEAGPNAVLAFRKEGYRKTDVSLKESSDMLRFAGFWPMAKKFWRTGMSELYRSMSKAQFTRDLQVLLPEVRSEDLVPAGSGVRAQAVNRNGALLDDFTFVQQPRALHVCNVPSPAATASLVIGQHIAQTAATQFNLNSRLQPQMVSS